MNIFKEASKIGLRFETPKGQIDVEDLWDLPLVAVPNRTEKVNLDDIAKGLHAKLEGSTVKSFVTKQTAADDVTKLQFDIVIEIINDKLAEAEAASLAKQTREKKQRIMEIIERKQNSALEETPLEDLMEMVKAL